jgi:acetyl esterase
MNLGERLRRQVGAFLVDSTFKGLSKLGSLHPSARPARHSVTVERHVPYRDMAGPEHQLDIYRPTRGGPPYPVVLYVHGGGFRILSKDTHWVMGLAFARRGYLVFNINYRLAPEHPYPAAVEDACAAYEWVVANAASYGGDVSRLVLAGESAGANLVTALAVSACYARPEPYARRVFETGVVPRAVVPACGILQVSDVARLERRRLEKNRPFSRFLRDRMEEIEMAYLSAATPHAEGGTALADPLLIVEGGAAPARPLPPFFAPVGTKDPLLDDTRRLKTALDKLGARCEVRYYPGEVHAFHAMVFLPNARRCWKDTYQFLSETVGG